MIVPAPLAQAHAAWLAPAVRPEIALVINPKHCFYIAAFCDSAFCVGT